MLSSSFSTQRMPRPVRRAPERNMWREYAERRTRTTSVPRVYIEPAAVATVELSTYAELLEWATDITGRHNVLVRINPHTGEAIAIQRATGDVHQRAIAPAFNPHIPFFPQGA